MSESIFNNKKCDFKKLKAYGFKLKQDIYIFETQILNGQFTLRIEVDKEGTVNSYLFDRQTKEEYRLHKNENLTGAFIGQVREEYDKILSAIAEKCFSLDSFKTKQAKQIISYIKEKYGDKLEFLWADTPDCAIARRKDNKKWYLVIMTVKKDRLGFKTDEPVEVMNLTAESEEVAKIIDHKIFFPAYHMNKKTWFSILLENINEIEQIFDLIDRSYKKVKKN